MKAKFMVLSFAFFLSLASKVNGQLLPLWNASDLRGLPVRLEANSGAGMLTPVFKEIKPGKPTAKLFEPPAAYSKFATLEALYQAKVKFPDKP